MTRQDWKDSRSDLYLYSIVAMQNKQSPLPDTRVSILGCWNRTMTTWQDVVDAIVFLVGNRQDGKRTAMWHTPVACNKKQWSGRRDWYNSNIKELAI